MLPTETQAFLDSAEYICQALNFTPHSISDSIYNTLCTYATDGMNALESTLKQEFGDVITDESELTIGKNKILSQFLTVFQEKYTKFDEYLFLHIFHVPDDYVFPEDEIQLKFDASEAEDEKLDDEIDKIIQEIKEQKTKNEYLKQEALLLDKTISECSKEIEFFQKVKDAASNSDGCLDEVKNMGAEIQKLREK